jgi:hypothetical protein
MSKKQPEIGKYQFTPNDQKYLEDFLKNAEKKEWDRIQEIERKKLSQFSPDDLSDLITRIDELRDGNKKYKTAHGEYEEEQDRLAREYEGKGKFKRRRT